MPLCVVGRLDGRVAVAVADTLRFLVAGGIATAQRQEWCWAMCVLVEGGGGWDMGGDARKDWGGDATRCGAYRIGTYWYLQLFL